MELKNGDHWQDLKAGDAMTPAYPMYLKVHGSIVYPERAASTRTDQWVIPLFISRIAYGLLQLCMRNCLIFLALSEQGKSYIYLIMDKKSPRKGSSFSRPQDSKRARSPHKILRVGAWREPSMYDG